MTCGRTRAWDDGFDHAVPFLARLEKEDRAALLALRASAAAWPDPALPHGGIRPVQ
ncbi:hypothetical protein [Streptomyces sp. PSKA30]|uniref:hypothetical protein n=1 Tax=Streptomyces sp. PSKA30 TaxID=2874597 RepID=UPI0035B128CC